MDAEDFELYKREVEILKICQHAHIIRLLDVFENSEYIYIVMEHLSGGSLLGYFKQKKYKVSEKRVKDIAHQIATALFYLKSFGIAHRDMKPDNIMMATNEDDSEIKLIDFGLSKIIGPKERSKDPFGTIPYAAPEIILRKPYSHSVDVWSLGVTLFFLLSGFHPFDSHDQQELLKKIVRQDPDYEADEWSNISDEAKDLVKKLLEKDKEKRIEIEQVLEHEWITKGNEKLKLMRRKSDTYLEKFNAFAITKAEDEEDKKDDS
jgi:serine/threonine protein kinase